MVKNLILDGGDVLFSPQIKKIEELGFQTRILSDTKKEQWFG